MFGGNQKTTRLFRFLLLILGISCLQLAFYIWRPAFIAQIDYKIYDSLLRLHAGGTPSPLPVIVDIDEASLAEYGQWPWPRYIMARLVANLAEQGAAVTAFDVILSEHDRTSPVRLKKDLKTHLDFDADFKDLPEDLQDYDILFTTVLDPAYTVLAFYTTDKASNTALPQGVKFVEQYPLGAVNPASGINRAAGGLFPLPEFSERASLGAINSFTDFDGLVRSVPLLSQIEGRIYPSLALRALMLQQNVKSLVLAGDEDGLNSIKLGKTSIPVKPNGALPLLYRGGAGQYPYYSVKDVMEGKLPPDALKDRIALVGTSSAGLLDIRSTPFEAVLPGVEVHATVIDNILNDRYISIPPWSLGAQAIAVLLCSVLAGFLFGRGTMPVYSIGGLCMLGAVWGASIALFRNGVYFSPLFVTMAIIISGLLIISLRVWGEEVQKRAIQAAFGRYVAPEVVERIVNEGAEVFSGEEKEVSILFTDLRGFTSISEKLSPSQVVRLLNRYFTPMTALVRNNKGTLDKFIGDALMAFWNAPLDVAEHPKMALQTVMQMTQTLKELNPELKKEFGIELRMGAGLHCGKVSVGNMGSNELLSYTIIGDSVNLASRIEGLTSTFGVPALVSGELREKCGDAWHFAQLDSIMVKGRTQPVDIYLPLGEDEANTRKKELETHTLARQLYTEGSFANALEMFEALHAEYPEQKMYNVYLERCQHFLQNPPPPGQLVWQMTSK